MIVIDNGIAHSDSGMLVGLKGKGITFEALSVDGIDTDDLIEVARPVDHDYGERVNALIRERYSLSEELALLRQRDSKAAEFAEYNDFCEECKRRAREEGAES